MRQKYRIPASVTRTTLRGGLRGVFALFFLLAGWPGLTLAAPQGQFPWRQAGLSAQEAAAHLLDRFTYGPRPGQVEQVVNLGLERWFRQQLEADQSNASLTQRLKELKTLQMSASEMRLHYPPHVAVLRRAQEAGILDRGDRSKARRDPDLRRKLLAFMREQEIHRQGEMYAELFRQRVYRAVYSPNQLQEVLTAFWFNHFNVSVTDAEARNYIPSYEYDAIRPHVLGHFRELLGATARHPAMLTYLDNTRSTADEKATTTLEMKAPRGFKSRRGDMGKRPKRRGDKGINENYARELMELHTLGVDGGYDQRDVIEVARAFTGWTVVPSRKLLPDRAKGMLAKIDRRGAQMGFVHEGVFLFRADAHDAGTKRVLGFKIATGGGIEDGERVLDILASRPATAHHIATQLARRFVSDDPPKALVDRLASTFLKSGGDIRAVVWQIPCSPEFWSESARAQKIKSPFELAISALRALDAQVHEVAGIIDWVSRMGQPLYACVPPTGFPDRAEQWVSAGALLARMNFGLELASGGIAGVDIDLKALLGGRQPESAKEALRRYAQILLVGRDLEPTLTRVQPMLSPEAWDRLAEQAPAPQEPQMAGLGADKPDGPKATPLPGLRGWSNPFRRYQPGSDGQGDHSTPARVVGLILGSPEFQRR